MRYKVEVFDVEDKKIGETTEFESLKQIYEIMFTDDELNYFYNDAIEDGEQGYILLPCIGFVEAHSVARKLFPEEFETFCKEFYKELVSKAEFFFKKCKTDEFLREKTKCGYVNINPTNGISFIIYEVEEQ